MSEAQNQLGVTQSINNTHTPTTNANMKLTIKTLTQSIFKVDIEPDRTVKDLKETIEREQGKDYPCGSQKLIYNGKILADENKLAEYEFDEKKFVVLMITRPPPAPKPAAEQTTSKSDDKSKPTSRRSAVPAASAATSAAPTTATTVSSNISTNPSANTATSDTTQSSRNTQQQQPPQPPSGRSSALSDMSMGEPQLARLAALMSQPHFRQMQDLIQQSPHLLSATIESIAGSDPEMYNYISENPDVFISALNHPPLPISRSSAPSTGQRQSSQGRGGSQQAVGVQGGGGPEPVMDQLLGDGVSEHDKEAIERLKELGFSEYLAVQAYMACDKDEQLAANLLFQMDQ